MTIDETIEHSRNIAKEQRYYANFEKGMMRGVCINTAENNEQLAEWLEELKEARKRFEETAKQDISTVIQTDTTRLLMNLRNYYKQR